MNRFSRIRHHVSVEDVKKKHLEKIAVENFKKEEEVIVKKISNRFRRDWKREIFEGMTTANIMTAPLAPAGDEVFIDTPTTSADVFDVAPARDPGFSYDAMVGTSIKSSGSGTGNNGGFNIGNHVAFDGSGSGGARWCVLKAVDTTEVDTMVVRAITGNGSNGGQTPDETLEDLILYYKTPEMFDYIPITYFPELTGSAFQGGNDIIIPVGHGLSGLQDYQIKIPSYARGKETRFLLYQVASTASGQDTYGLTNISFRRQTPVNVVVPLDSPEAISFINVGTNEGDPKKRKKKVDDMLSASDEYTTKQMGDQFPGQGGRIDGEDPFKSAPLTPDDVIERSPIGKSEVKKSFANFSTTAAAAQPEAEPAAEPAEDPQVITTRQSTIATDPEGNEIDPKPIEAGAMQGADATNLDQEEPTDPEPTDPEPIDPDQEEAEQELETDPDVDNKEEAELNQQLDNKLNALEKALAFGVESNLLGLKKLMKVIKFAAQGILSVTTIGNRLYELLTGDKRPIGSSTAENNLQGGLSVFLNSMDIAMSVMDGEIKKSNPTAKQIETYRDSILPNLFKDNVNNFIPISDVRHEYADANIYVERINGKAVVRDNTGGIRQDLTNKDKMGSVGGEYAGFKQVGGGYSQFIIPKDGGEPYIHFYDYNYHNINNDIDVSFEGGILQSGGKVNANTISATLSNLIHQLRPSNTKLNIPARARTSMIGYFTNFKDVLSALQTTSTLEGWPPGIHGAALTDITIPLSELPKETQEMIANHPLSWTPERIANMSEEDYFDEIDKRSERFEDDDYILKAMEDPDSGVDPEFLENYKRFDFYTQYDENTGTHPDAKEGTVQYDYDRAVEELEKVQNSPEYNRASDAATKEWEDVSAEQDEKYAENEEKFGSKAQSDLYEKLVGPYYRAVQNAIRGGGSISKNSPTYQKMVNGYKEYEKQKKVMERKYEQERDAIFDKYKKLSEEAYARLVDTFQVKELDDGTMGLVNGGDFKTKNGKVIPGMGTLSAKEKARFDEVRAEYEEVQDYLYSDAANYMDNLYKPFVLYDVKTQFGKYGVSGDSWTPKNPKGSESKSDPTPDPSFTGSAASFVGGDATAAATAAAETNRRRKKNESLEKYSNPYGGVTLYEKLKAKGFFNPKDIKPTFPENDPPEIDKKTGMHPNYGKQAKRYNKLDPISANAMPPTGDPEIDAVVDKQRTKPKTKKQKYLAKVSEGKKYNWREDFTNITTGNKVGQTFRHNPTGATFTTSGGLGGVESTSKTVTLDLGLDGFFTVDAPTYDQLALAGFAKPILMKRRKSEDTNKKLEASQEFAKKANADVMMNARVGVYKDLSSEGIKLVSKILGTLGDSRIVKELKTFFDYLNDDLPDKITNEYFSKKHLKSLWSQGFINDKGKFAVNDFIIGSGQRLTYDPNTDRYSVKFNYDFSTNAEEMLNNPGKYNNLLGRIRAISGGKYGLDALTLPGLLVTAQKAKGLGKGVDGEISISREELLKINRTLPYMNDIVNPENSGGFDTGHGYSSPPEWLNRWASKSKFSGDLRSLWDNKTRTWNLGGKIVDNSGKPINQGTFDKDGNYIPPGYEDAIGTDEIKNLGRPPFRGKVEKGVYDLSNTYSSGASEAEVEAAYEKARKGIPSLPPFSELTSEIKPPDNIPEPNEPGWTYQEYMDMLDAIADKAAAASLPITNEILEYGPGGSKTGDVPIGLTDAQEAITIARTNAEEALHQAWERYNKMPDLSGYGMDPSRDTETEPRPVRGGQGGRRLGSTTQRQGGAYSPSSIGFDRKETPFRNKKKNVRGSGARGGRKGRVNESNTFSKIKKFRNKY